MQRILVPALEAVPVHPSAHGVAGRSAVSAAQEHCGAYVLVGLDLADWFGHVTSLKIEEALIAAGWKPGAAQAVEFLTTEAGHLPQGACTSPILANITAMPLDLRLAHCAARWGFHYTRYADDLTFSTKERCDCGRRIKALRRSVVGAVRACGFEINQAKVRVAYPYQRQEVVGLITNGEGVPRVARGYLRRVRAALHNYDCCRSTEWTFPQLRGAIAFIQGIDEEKGKRLLRQYRAIRAKYQLFGLG